MEGDKSSFVYWIDESDIVVGLASAAVELIAEWYRVVNASSDSADFVRRCVDAAERLEIRRYFFLGYAQQVQGMIDDSDGSLPFEPGEWDDTYEVA